jgi:2-polyprenyl-6-methoxyphenol hydroxylase-like FAD-dependent oxidoreductase
VILDQLGLLPEFDRIARGRMRAIDFRTTDGPLVHQPLDEVNRRHPFHEVALAPQWDLLDLLVRRAQQYPSFRILMEAETTDALSAAGAVRGVRYRQGGVEHDLRAVLTVDAEGRGSALRAAIGSEVVRFGAPIDVLWFRLPRRQEDFPGLRGVLGHGGAVVAVNREDYWQVALIVPKGSADDVRAAGLDAFQARVARLAPWLADRVGEVTDWDQVKLLAVTVERLKRWSARGILAIGDAAHTMSPVGGVGINLAIADAVATANLLGPRLKEAQADPERFARTLNPALLRQVQQRRLPATVVTQRIQVLAQNRIIALVRTPEGSSLRPPAPVRAVVQALGSRLAPEVFAYGLRPERIARQSQQDGPGS